MSIPMTSKTFQFEQAHATVVFTNDHSAATGLHMPKLHVQMIDAYRYQRELTVQFRWEPGNSKVLFWECHIYRHPGRRLVTHVTQKTAERFIERFLHLCEEYPTLLFNEASDGKARCEGFVHLAERLHDGVELSAKLI